MGLGLRFTAPRVEGALYYYYYYYYYYHYYH